MTLDSDTKIVRTGACYDCGGRCVHKLYVQNGRVVRMETDDGEEPQLRSCARGRAYRQIVYHPDRLRYPMKRAGSRGEGKFERISWDEALDTIATEFKRVKEKYGNAAILGSDWSGPAGIFHGQRHLTRILNLFGGGTMTSGGASGENSTFAARAVYGTMTNGNTRDDHMNSKLMILWGWNPANSIWSTGTTLHLVRARETGARVIYIDPRFTDSAATLADQWIPIRPGTDAALLLAMANVIITENLQEQSFLNKYTVGFDIFRNYVTGTGDGVPKTSHWAENVTGIPATIIEQLAREYATLKPAALIPGYAPGRTAYGTEFHRLTATLAAMTGNIGIHGGGAAGFERGPVGIMIGPVIPQGRNPLEEGTPSLRGSLDTDLRRRFRPHHCEVWDLILRGKAGGYPTDIKLLYVVGSDVLNQFPNVNKGVQALQKLEFIVMHEQFITPTAKFADILLPANTNWERNDIARPWLSGPYYIFMNQAIDSMYETKSDFEIFCALGKRLGITYSDKTEEEWLEKLVRTSADLAEDIPDYEKFKKDGVQKLKLTGPQISFEKEINDPGHNPFPTPSGKIEIYSDRLAKLNNPSMPAVPKYIETWESVNDPMAEKYPLQLVTTHHKTRAHSCFDNVSWLKELEPQVVWINRIDSESRGIRDGQQVLVFNERGKTVTRAKVTERIMPGVVSMGEGAWYTPDKNGIDWGGNPNVLTRDSYCAGGGWPTNTCLVEVLPLQEELAGGNV
ncbi:MAG: molybdopterin-dependent oxidoreductase [Chloroflexi bacterium]|nr:molybdopterin-dependent oxidoreductase [Chloroflexota bacterium]